MAVREIIDLTGRHEEMARDPYPVYAQVRARGPVHWVRTEEGGESWMVVGYEEARAALADPRFSKEWYTGPDDEAAGISRHMLDSDPPRHTRLRRLVAREFTGRRVAALRPRIQQVTDELLDAMLPLGRADLIESLAFPLPMTVICELLGVPDLDRGRFRRWSQALVGDGDLLVDGEPADAAMSECTGDAEPRPPSGLLPLRLRAPQPNTRAGPHRQKRHTAPP
jgi:cytochrome P450